MAIISGNDVAAGAGIIETGTASGNFRAKRIQLCEGRPLVVCPIKIGVCTGGDVEGPTRVEHDERIERELPQFRVVERPEQSKPVSDVI